MRRSIVLCVLATLLMAACEEPAEIIQIGVGEQVFTVEVVRTGADKQIGLMNRDSIPQDYGMIFVYTVDDRLKFWMKNTRIPLSIAFLSAEGKVTEIRDMRPYSQDPITSRLAVRYALEVNQGAFAAAGVSEGDSLRLPAGFR